MTKTTIVYVIAATAATPAYRRLLMSRCAESGNRIAAANGILTHILKVSDSMVSSSNHLNDVNIYYMSSAMKIWYPQHAPNA